MAEIKWTLQALDDVEAITEFIARDSIHYAQLFAGKIFNAVQQLGNFPKSGRTVPEFDEEKIREIILGNYRIIYRTSEENINILTVYHSSRLLTHKNIQQ